MKFWWMEDKSAESILEFKEDLEDQRNKIDADILGFIGIDGSIKGLPLLEASVKGYNGKLFAGLVTENYRGLDKTGIILSFGELEFNTAEFQGGLLFFKPIAEKVVFSGFIKEKNELKTLQKWLDKRITEIKSLFQKDK